MMASAPTPDDLDSRDWSPEQPLRPEASESEGNLHGLWPFFGVLVGLVALDLLLAVVQVPEFLILPASVVVTALVVGAPIIALYKASSVRWSWSLAGIVFLSGFVVWSGLAYGLRQVPDHYGLLKAFLGDLSQAGLVTWCLGLGAFVATLIRDKNLLLPIAFFLAAFDVFLVLTPIGITQSLLKAQPDIYKIVAYAVPTVRRAETHSGTGPVRAFAYIGPADFMFLGMFFISLYRFRMRTTETFRWILPTLLGYLAIVVVFGGVHLGRFSLGALPALLPIGAVVLLVNRKEWKLTQEEKMSTLVVAALAVGLVVFGMTRKPPQPVQAAPEAEQGQVGGPNRQQPPSKP